MIGQTRAITLMHSLLIAPKFMTRGIILEGPSGVGKTTSGYLLARALMCTGDKPLGCGQCPSCECCESSLQERRDLAYHPDFLEVDAASHSGVDKARDIIERAESMAVLGQRRVVLADEAHEYSKPAWDTYLKPLERGNLDTIYLFSTNHQQRIPDTIQSRCIPVTFSLVESHAIVSRLVAKADRFHIAYDLEALRRIAVLAKGKPRVADRHFGVVAAKASQDRLTLALVNFLLELDVEETVGVILDALVRGALADAVVASDPLVGKLGTSKAIAACFEGYATRVFADPTILSTFPVKSTTTCLLKWTSQDLPADAFALFLAEWNDLRPGLLGANRSEAVFSAGRPRAVLSPPARPAGSMTDGPMTAKVAQQIFSEEG